MSFFLPPPKKEPAGSLIWRPNVEPPLFENIWNMKWYEIYENKWNDALEIPFLGAVGALHYLFLQNIISLNRFQFWATENMFKRAQNVIYGELRWQTVIIRSMKFPAKYGTPPKNLKRKIEKNESFEIHPNAEPRGVLYVGGFALWMDNAHASAKKDFPFGGYSSPSARSKPKPPPKFCNPSKFTQPLGPNWPKPNFSYPRNLGNPWETSETPNWSDPWTWGKKKGNAGKYEIEASLSEQQ